MQVVRKSVFHSYGACGCHVLLPFVGGWRERDIACLARGRIGQPASGAAPNACAVDGMLAGSIEINGLTAVIAYVALGTFVFHFCIRMIFVFVAACLLMPVEFG